MSSIFTRIIEGEIPSYKVYEDELFYAFLDINPLVRGHVLVVPKEEVDKYFDLSEDLLSKIMPVCKKISRAISEEFPCKRVGMTVIGLEVPHAHVHLIPINTISDIDFTRPKLNLRLEELAEIAERLRSRIS